MPLHKALQKGELFFDTPAVRMNTRASSNGFCILKNSGERTTGKDGVVSCGATFFCLPYSDHAHYTPQIGISAHPIWSDLFCVSTMVKRQNAGAIIQANYEGVIAAGMGDSNSERTVEISTTVREEPIETHPDFASWAGTPQNPNGGVFDEDGKFTGWNSKTALGAEMAGVKSYLVPSSSATISYLSRSRPSLARVGTIQTPAGLPAVSPHRTWLFTGLSYQKLQDGSYKVTENYLLSGAKGWNTRIYD
jgi:hypothetical protein